MAVTMETVTNGYTELDAVNGVSHTVITFSLKDEKGALTRALKPFKVNTNRISASNIITVLIHGLNLGMLVCT